MTIATVNPATGQMIRTFSPLSEPELDARLQCAADAFRRYRRTAIGERTRILQRAAEILDADKEKFARIMVMEMGKTLKAAVEEAEKCASGRRHSGDRREIARDQRQHAGGEERDRSRGERRQDSYSRCGIAAHTPDSDR